MTTVEFPPTVVGEQRLLISQVSWDLYRRMRQEITQRSLRLSYSEGMLEVMIIGHQHERYKKLLAKLVECIVLERNIPISSGGSMTFQRDDLEKGLEPDECWWIAHESSIRGKAEFDFLVDPPSDLAVEVEVSHSLVGRISIYADDTDETTRMRQFIDWLRTDKRNADDQIATLVILLSVPNHRREVDENVRQYYDLKSLLEPRYLT